MASSLDYLLSEGIISEVLARLKSGKEADVYVVLYGGNAVAAKVYKDRAHRSFKNNASYKEGRSVRNSRSQRAIDRGSKFGKASAEDAWKSAEADALYKLHSAGVRVPTPVMFLEGVLLMELVLDAEGAAAPRLIDTDLTAEQANQAYHDMLKQLVRILSCELIHGDLSPYNVLWAATGPTIIDFPQIISAAHNNSSETFFLRDARNILGYFAGIDRSLNARSGDAGEIWRAYARRELTPDFVPTGRQRPPQVQVPQRPAFDPRRSFEARPPIGETHAPRRPAGNPQQGPPRNDERNGNGSSTPRRPEIQPPREHGADEMQGAPRRHNPLPPQHVVDGTQGGHRQGGNQPPRHHQGTGETQGQHRQGGSQQGGNQPPRHYQGTGETQGQHRQGGSQPPRHPGNRDARPEQQGNQPLQGRPAPSPQGPRSPQPPRQDGGPPRSFTPQRRALHVPEVIVRHRFPSPAPAVETAIETAAVAPEHEKTDAPAGPRRRRRNRRS